MQMVHTKERMYWLKVLPDSSPFLWQGNDKTRLDSDSYHIAEGDSVFTLQDWCCCDTACMIRLALYGVVAISSTARRQISEGSWIGRIKCRQTLGPAPSTWTNITPLARTGVCVKPVLQLYLLYHSLHAQSLRTCDG